MLTNDELAQIIKAAFRQALPSSTLDRLTFEVGEDHDGDPAVFIWIPQRQADDSDAILPLLDGTNRLRSELRKRGDTRLPYLRYEPEAQSRERVP